MNKLFFDKWKDDRYFLKDRTPYSLLENKYQGYGHTFHYNDSKEPEEICFEWVRFVSTLFLNVSDVKKKIGALKYLELHEMHYMCRTLLEKSSLDDYYKIMNKVSGGSHSENHVLYALQSMACIYIPHTLCAFLKKIYLTLIFCRMQGKLLLKKHLGCYEITTTLLFVTVCVCPVWNYLVTIREVMMICEVVIWNFAIFPN